MVAHRAAPGRSRDLRGAGAPPCAAVGAREPRAGVDPGKPAAARAHPPTSDAACQRHRPLADVGGQSSCTITYGADRRRRGHRPACPVPDGSCHGHGSVGRRRLRGRPCGRLAGNSGIWAFPSTSWAARPSVPPLAGAIAPWRARRRDRTEGRGHLRALGRHAPRDRAQIRRFLDQKVLDASLFQHYGDGPIEDLWLPFYAVAADLSSMTLTELRTGPLWEAVRASSAIPGILPPFFTSEGKMLVDGGCIDNMPFRTMHRSQDRAERGGQRPEGDGPRLSCGLRQPGRPGRASENVRSCRSEKARRVRRA